MGIRLREQRRLGAPLHVENASGLHRVQQPQPLRRLLRSSVDVEERHGARSVLLLLLKRVGGSGEDVAERAMRAEFHRVGVSTEVAGAQIHPKFLGGGGGDEKDLVLRVPLQGQNSQKRYTACQSSFPYPNSSYVIRRGRATGLDADGHLDGGHFGSPRRRGGQLHWKPTRPRSRHRALLVLRVH
jgi:hypothetical protein